MNETLRRRKEWALGALDRHEKKYGRAVTGALKKFWSGDPWKYDGAKMEAKLPTSSQAAWQLSVVPPLWSALEDAGLGDAVFEWEQVGDYVPLFQPEDETCMILAALKAPHMVGSFDGGSIGTKQKGYRDGVFILADSLDAFLAKLKLAPKGKPPRENIAWSDLDDYGESGDDDED
jgi:hypothetical protein